MGDPRKLKPKFRAPRKVWDSERIKEETPLIREYGLKNTKELWIAKQQLKKDRRSARLQLSRGEEGRVLGQKLIDKLVRLGIADAQLKLEDVLSLTVRDYLERRLQTRVLKKGLARTHKQARQLISHGFISINGRKVTIPSYVVTAAEENAVSYYKAIDISPPEQEKPKTGAAARQAARETAKQEAETVEAPAKPDTA